MKISFSGIYDVRFPQGTTTDEIMNKYTQTKKFVYDNYSGKLDIFDVRFMDYFDTQKTDRKLAPEGIRISTSIDNPHILSHIFSFIQGESKNDLVQQYVNKSKVELILDA